MPTTRHKLDVTRLLAAFRRGAGMNLDLNVDWDPWPVMGKSVEVLRERYNILSVSHFMADDRPLSPT